MLCILYINAFGAVLGAIGLLVERLMPPGASRRWIWCAVIALSVVVPGVYSAQHTAAVDHTLAAAGAGVIPFLESTEPVIGSLWYIMSAGVIAWALYTAWQAHRIIRSSGRQGLSFIVTKSAGPATVGVWNPRVIIPRWVLALPRAQRRYILRHEEEHRSAHDARLLFIASLTLILLPWNIALWWQLRRLRLAVEMDCDNRVVSALGNASDYGELLFKVALASSRAPAFQPAFLGTSGMLEKRLESIVAPRPLMKAQRILLPIAVCILLFIALAVPHPVMTSPAHSHPSSSTTR